MLPRQFANWVLRRTQSKWLSSTRSSGSRSMAISSTKVLPILVVAALGRELHALSANPQPELELLETGEGIANAERNVEDWQLLLRFRAIQVPEKELLETGEGIANAERNVEDWLEHRSARAVLSIGF